LPGAAVTAVEQRDSVGVVNTGETLGPESSGGGGANVRPPLVGVLTPVYNGERYLAECIESVLRQTYRNWEHVIVDNRSRDRTLTIADDYARKDPRIRVVRGETFVGAAENHNRALSHLPQRAVYCKFLHADDWLFPTCLEEMVSLAETQPSVGVVGAYRLDGERVNLDGLPYPSSLVPGRTLCRATLMGHLYVFGSPSSVMFRAALIRKHGFDAERFPRHSDSAACLEVLRESDFGFVHQVLTYTRRPAEAQTSLSVRLNSYLAEQVVALARYGPIFLTPEEHSLRYKSRLRRYRRFLASNLLRRQEATFWQYHRHTGETLGLPLNAGRLAFAVLSLAVDVAARPARRVRRALTALRKSTASA
jgi:glycosyltransferase involved in cell wall biosynthesis